MAKIKKLDLQKLRLSFYFHSSYAYLERKESSFLLSLTKNGVDGLYLKSRGAKIRVLPWEYSVNSVSILDKKGRQYGLEKDEYKKEEASLYFYRTKQYIENSGSVLLLQAGASPKKGDYSYLFSLRLIAKYLKSVQSDEGKFPTESALMQLSTVRALLNSSKTLEDSSLVDSAKRALNYFLFHFNKNEVTDAYMLNLFFSFPELKEQNVSRRAQESSQIFSDFDRVKGAILANPLYAGIFLQVFNSFFRGSDKVVKVRELLEFSFGEFSKMDVTNRLKFIAYLSEFKVDDNSQLFVIMKDFFNSQTSFLKRQQFDCRNFAYEKGSFKAKSGFSPDYSLSLLLAQGLSQAILNGYYNFELLEIVSQMKHFINYLIVTGDDFPNWSNLQEKSKIQGAVRAHPMSKGIKFSNTVRAFSYFINKVGYDKNDQ